MMVIFRRRGLGSWNEPFDEGSKGGLIDLYGPLDQNMAFSYSYRI